MTLAASDRLSGPHDGDGITVDFPYGFPILASSELRVIVRNADGEDETKTLGVDYTVSDVGEDAGGEVSFTTAPAAGEKVIIEGATPRVQSNDYTTTDRFPAESHEEALDRLTRIVQENARDIARALKYPHGETVYRMPLRPSGTKALGQLSTGRYVHLEPTDFDADVLLGEGAESILGADRGLVLAVATRADLQALGGDDLDDDQIYHMKCCLAPEDHGGGRFSWRSGDQSALCAVATKTVTAVDAASDILTAPSHGFYDGDAIVASAADAGLAARTVKYFARRIRNGVSDSPAAAIGSTPQNVATGAFDYWIMGTAYSKAAVPAGTALNAESVPLGKYGAQALDIDAAGTITAVSAPANTTGYLTAAAAAAALPASVSGRIRATYVTASKSDGAFVFGTTSLAAANTTVAYTSSALNAADYVSLHASRAGARANTGKVNLSALAGALSLIKLVDPGQGYLVIRDGDPLDGSAGCFVRLTDAPWYCAAWYGQDASASATVNSEAYEDGVAGLPVTPDTNFGTSFAGGALKLADGLLSLEDRVHVFDGKSGRIVGGQNTQIVGTFTADKAIFQSGNATYDGETTGGSYELGYFQHEYENFSIGKFSIGHGYGVYSYVRGCLLRGCTLQGATLADFRLRHSWRMSGTHNCFFQGGPGRAIHADGFSNFVQVRRGRISGYFDADEAVLIEGALKAVISKANIEYNKRHFRVVGTALQGGHGAIVETNWFEGDRGEAGRFDNTTYDLSAIVVRGNLVSGEHNGGYPDSGKIIIGVTGGAGTMVAPQADGNWFAGPSSAALSFLSGADKYQHLAHDYGARNTFSGGAGISAPNRPELETYPQPRAFTVNVFGSGGNATVGDGVFSGKFTRIGDDVAVRYYIEPGSTTVMWAGNASLPLPYNAAALEAAAGRRRGVDGYISDVSAPAEYACEGHIIPNSDPTVAYLLRSPGVAVTHAAPMTFAAGDTLQLDMRYRAAAL